MKPQQNVVELAGIHRAGRFLSIALSLLLGATGTLAFAADQNVINTNDSGAGSLRQAVADVGAGENVSFQPAVAGGTINLTSDTLDVTRSMNFLNNSGGVVTISGSDQYYTNITGVGTTTSFDSGLAFQSSTAVDNGNVTALSIQNSHTINGLHSTLSASSLSDAGGKSYGALAFDDLNITGGGLTGDISASSFLIASTGSAGSYGIVFAGANSTITGGINSVITTETTGSSTGGDFDSVGISSYGDLTISGGLQGSISASLTNGTVTSGTNTCRGLDVLNTLEVNDGLSADITAISYDGNVEGIYARNLAVNGGISGTILAYSQTLNGSAMGIQLGDFSFGHIDEISGLVDCLGNNAVGIFAGGSLNGGNQDIPLVISGCVTVAGVNMSDAIVYVGPLNIKVESTGALYADSVHLAGYAIRGFGQVAEDDVVELVAGCSILGNIFLGGAADHDTLTLSGDNEGTSTINGDIWSFGSAHLDIGVTGGNWYINGEISRAASLNVSGGSITLLGLNTYTRNTTVDDGVLIVNGQIVGDLTINGGILGGIVGGVGPVGNLSHNGARAPGKSIGTMTVAGDYTQNPGATLEIEINDAGASDLLDVAGAATINGGRVLVVAEPGAYTAGTTYTFLTASSVTGEFDDITEGVIGFDTTLVYNPDSIQFYLTSHYINQARTFNQRAVAGYLADHVGTATGDFLTVLTELDTLYGDSARAAMDSMSGELYPSLSTVGIENTDRFLRNLAARLRARGLGLAMTGGPGSLATDVNWNDSDMTVRAQDSCDCTEHRPTCWKPWAEGFGIGASIAGNGNASGLGYSTGGVTFGIENDLTEKTLFGVVGGYANTYVALDERVDRATIDSGQVGVYLNHTNDLGYATAIAAFDASSYDTRRQVVIGEIARTANAGYNGSDFSFYLETGRCYQLRRAHLQPYAALQYIQLHQNDFIESGAQSVDLSVGGVHADSFRGLLGTRLVSFMRTNSGRLLSLEGRALWRHEFLDEARVLDATFTGQPGPAFVINGVNVDRDAAILGGGVGFCLAQGAKLFVDYDLLVSENYTAHAGSGGLMFVW